MRTIDLVERQIIIAKRKNQPRVLAKLEKELAELNKNKQEPKQLPTIVVPTWNELSSLDKAAILNY